LLKTAEPRAKLEQLFAERDPLYRSVADMIVDTGNQSLGSLAQRLEQLLIERQSAAAEGAGAPLRAG
jgi:shikimate kinase